MLRDGFGARPCFECLLAEAGGEAVGFAIHRPNYSTFEGRPGLFVEDPVRRRAGPQARRRAHADGAPCRDRAERGCSHMTSRCCDRPGARVPDRISFSTSRTWLPYGVSDLPLARLAADDRSAHTFQARHRAGGTWTIAQPIDFSLQRDWQGRQPFLVADSEAAMVETAGAAATERFGQRRMI